MAAFSLKWPSEAQPARITSPFNPTTGAVGIYAPTDTRVFACADGKVIAISGYAPQPPGSGPVRSYSVLVQSGVYTIIYSNLRDLLVHEGLEIDAGHVIGRSAGPESIHITVRQAVDITEMLVPPAPPPTPAPDAPKLYLRPTADGVRVREAPVNGKPIGQVYTMDTLVSLEPEEATRAKAGKKGEWLYVRSRSGLMGYVSAEFLRLASQPGGGLPPSLKDTNVLGMNLDLHNPLGRPDPAQLQGLGWIRVKFNVSLNPDRPHTDDNSSKRYGNTDIQAAFNRYRPFLEPYVRAGLKVLMVFTHQLYGEGAGFDWNLMDSGRWRQFSAKFAEFARRSVELWAPTGLVHAYQVWNEQDTEPGKGRAAVPVPARDYGLLLAETIKAIRAVNQTAPIITGGHARGPSAGGAYARATLAAMPADVRPDGIACHPYGRGVAGHPFSVFGALEDEIRAYGVILPDKPVWITEWGVLDRQGDLSVAKQVLEYATGFMKIVREKFPDQVAAAMWYAWADGMDNGYGLVDAAGRPKRDLYDRFLKI